MKKIIRLTESDLHNLIQRSVVRVLQEQDDTLLLQYIAQDIAQRDNLYARQGENGLEVNLDDGRTVYVKYEVMSSPFLRQGKRNSSYDVPNDEIVDDWDVNVIDICWYDDDNNENYIDDNGIVRKALKNTLQIDYSDNDIPNEKDYFYYED